MEKDYANFIHYLDRHAAEADICHDVSLERYYYNLLMLIEEARQCKQDGDVVSAYIKYLRYAKNRLVVVPNHKSYRMQCFAKLKSETYNALTQVMAELENLKAHELREYFERKQALKKKAAAPAPTSDSHASVSRAPSASSLAAKYAAKEVTPYGTAAPQSSLLRGLQQRKSIESSQGSTGVHSSGTPPAQAAAAPSSTAPDLPASQWDFDDIVQSSETKPGEMRRLTIPQSIIQKFLHVADRNTRNRIETCGILTGKLRNNILEMLTVIIPEQQGSENQCNTINEESLFNYQLENGLITLGWIHTHPVQTCFMSSIDLHTQAGYQIMLPEAIAIVVAPTDPTILYRAFHLTEHGRKVIRECPYSGSDFHAHNSGQLCDDAAHVCYVDRQFEIVDLRR
eukprot:Rmarinus@m.26629